MKKILSLLSILTISGTAIPTTIAARHYQKDETINSEINYLQTNNFENLIRVKRGNDNKFECHDNIVGSNYNLWIKISNNTWQIIYFQHDIQNNQEFSNYLRSTIANFYRGPNGNYANGFWYCNFDNKDFET